MKAHSTKTLEKVTNSDNLVISLIENYYSNGKTEFVIKNETNGVVVDSSKTEKKARILFESYTK